MGCSSNSVPTSGSDSGSVLVGSFIAMFGIITCGDAADSSNKIAVYLQWQAGLKRVATAYNSPATFLLLRRILNHKL